MWRKFKITKTNHVWTFVCHMQLISSYYGSHMQLTLLLVLTSENLPWKLLMMLELWTSRSIFDHPVTFITWMSLHLCGKRKLGGPSLELRSLKMTCLLQLQVPFHYLITIFMKISTKLTNPLAIICLILCLWFNLQRIVYQKVLSHHSHMIYLSKLVSLIFLLMVLTKLKSLLCTLMKLSVHWMNASTNSFSDWTRNVLLMEMKGGLQVLSLSHWQ